MFHFKQFGIEDKESAMKVGTDAVLLGAWADILCARRILDAGSGTGIIAIMLAQRSKATIDAVEIDARACDQSRQNFERCSWHSRLNLIESSFQKFTAGTSQSYDLIVSNPPFFSKSLKTPDKARAVARHDDALSAADLFEGISGVLSPSGKISLIIPFLSEDEWIDQANRKRFFVSRRTQVYPKENKPQNRSLIEFSAVSSGIISVSSITILDMNGKYTDEYKELTKDFYLAF
jgi:tRNA1Val (adenine37-N6)-methyltransferase